MKTLSVSSRWLAIPIVASALLLAGCAGSPVAGTSWPGITVDGETIYLAYHKVYAIAPDGKMKWAFPEKLASGQTFYAAPAVADDLIVVADYTDTVFGLSPETGETVWLFKSSRARFVSGAALGETLVYTATVDGVVHALNRNDGTEAWTFSAEGAIWATPLLDGETLYVVSLDRHVYALDAATGDLLWKFPERAEEMGPIVSAPTLHDGVLYFGSFNYHVYALDTATRRLLWEHDSTNWVWSSPVYDEESGLLIGADLDGQVFALKPEDGSLAWQYQAAGPVVGAPLLATLEDGTRVARVTVGADPNLVTLETATGAPAGPPKSVKATFETSFIIIPTGTTERAVPIYAPPVAADGLVLISAHEGNSQIYALDSQSLEKKWEFNGTKQEEAAKATDGDSSQPGGLFGDPTFLNTLLIVSVLILLFTLITGRRQQGSK